MDLNNLLQNLPAIDEQARALNIAMTNANHVFIGSDVSWSKSAAFADICGFTLPSGTVMQVNFPGQSFQGRLERRLCLWGQEDYLECPFPRNFTQLVSGKFRRCLDVTLNSRDELVMTYTPAGICYPAGDQAETFLCAALKVEVLPVFKAIDESYLNLVNGCNHLRTSDFSPDPNEAFLERTFWLCDSCGVVVSKTGACARDACDCSRHAENYAAKKICRTWS